MFNFNHTEITYRKSNYNYKTIKEKKIRFDSKVPASVNLIMGRKAGKILQQNKTHGFTSDFLYRMDLMSDLKRNERCHD